MRQFKEFLELKGYTSFKGFDKTKLEIVRKFFEIKEDFEDELNQFFNEIILYLAEKGFDKKYESRASQKYNHGEYYLDLWKKEWDGILRLYFALDFNLKEISMGLCSIDTVKFSYRRSERIKELKNIFTKLKGYHSSVGEIIPTEEQIRDILDDFERYSEVYLHKRVTFEELEEKIDKREILDEIFQQMPDLLELIEYMEVFRRP